MKKLKEINKQNKGARSRTGLGFGIELGNSRLGPGEPKEGQHHKDRVLNYIGQLQILEGLQARLRNDGYSEAQIRDFD